MANGRTFIRRQGTATCEIFLRDLVADDNWGHVFGDLGSLGKNMKVSAPWCEVDDSPVWRSDVVEVIAAVNGKSSESDWLGIFRLSGGRFLCASGACCCNGWGCHSSNLLIVATSVDDLIQHNLEEAEVNRLGLPLPARA